MDPCIAWPPTQIGFMIKRTSLLLTVLVMPYLLVCQTIPICDTPANGSNWRCLGPFSPPPPGLNARPANTGTGAKLQVKFTDPAAPNPQTLYACTPTGGLFRTNNVLDSVPLWENVTDSTRLPVLGVRGFAFEPGNPDVIYIGAGIRYPLYLRRYFGIGVLKTTDRGKSWQQTGLSFQQQGNWGTACHEILVHPTGHDTVYALCGPFLYKSTDAGESFVLKKTLEHQNPLKWPAAFRDIAFRPNEPDVLYLSSDANFFYRSLDGGESWEETNVADWGVEGRVGRIDIAVSAKNPDLVYLSCISKKAAILRSRDGGDSWQIMLDKNLNTSYEKNAFVVSPNDINTLYCGGLYVVKVAVGDSAASFSTIGGGDMHLDHRALTVVDDGDGNDIIYSANDGGLYRGFLQDKKWNWADVSGWGLNNMQFYGIAVAEDYSYIPGGTQDLGIMVIYPDGSNLKPSVGGDGTDCAIDKYDPSYAYGISWALGPPRLLRSTESGTKWGWTFEKGMEGVGDPYYYQLASHDNGNIYAGNEDIFRLPHKTETWLPIGDIPLPTELPYKITAMCVAPSDANVIYAYGDQLYKTENGMAVTEEVVWKGMAGNIGRAADPVNGGASILAIEVDAAHPEKVWLGFNSYQSEYKVYFSADGGSNWQNVSKGLPPYPVASLAFQAGTEDVLYAGTDVGVFYNPNASDPASEWLCFNKGLPVCLVADLEMNYCQGKIVAGTFGRGIWESPFGIPSSFKTTEISKDTVWDFAILRSDVVVKKGATLTMKGEIRAMPSVKIRVEKKARLILDGAHLKDLCGETWNGIELEEDNGGFFSFLFGKNPGELELKNGAVVENTTSGLPNK